MRRADISPAVTLIILILFVCDIYARPTTQKEAEKAVKGWLKASSRPLNAALGTHVLRIETYTDNTGSPIYYIVYLQPNGFVIVSGDDLIEPIIGFVQEGLYDPSPENPLGALVSADLKGRIESVRAGKPVRTKTVTGVSPEPQGKWNKFTGLADTQEKDIGILGLSSIDDARVDPFIQTRWNQRNICSEASACYNYYTPPSYNGQTTNFYCGCVATALAQIMYYYQRPNTGIGHNPFTVKRSNWDTNEVIYTRGGDGAGGAYNWGDMVTAPGCSTTLVQRQAIGALCLDAGVAISNRVPGAEQYTFYTANETTAYTRSAKVGLTSTFMYDNAVYGYNGGASIGEGLIGMVNPDLDAGKPVFFGIKKIGYSVGHAVVCDGYGYNAGTMYHHLNMGWSGVDDAWYDLPDINTSPIHDDYDSVYETIYNIFWLGDGEVMSGRVTDPCGNPISDVNVKQYIYPGPSVLIGHLTNARGIYAFTGVNSNTDYAVYATKPGYVFPPQTIIHTGHSTDSNATSGNLWGVDIVALGPDINTMSPTSGPGGTYMKIQGANFGSSPGQVVFPGVGYFGEILQWNNTVILCRVPWGPSSGSVKVRMSVGVEGAGVYFEVTNPTTIYVDVNHTQDIENGSITYPFSTIERGIYSATNADIVIVNPGNYMENISLDETNITLTSIDPNDPCIVASTVIDGGENGTVVTFSNNCSVLTGFTITNGTAGAGFGGGIYCSGQCEESAPTISHCIITRNLAMTAGGGIYCYNSSPTIHNCIIRGNSASSGGGILCDNEYFWYYPTINNCLITGNMAMEGGGVYVANCNPTISHCDFSSNMAMGGGGGGIFCDESDLLVSHTILWNDLSVYNGSEIYITNAESPVTIEYSDVNGGLAGMYYPEGNPPYWDANDINANPMFVRDPNPGPDGWWNGEDDDFGDLHLQSISPCIDAGDPDYEADPNEKDMDGQPRVVGCRPDMGPDEFVYLADSEPDGDVDFADFSIIGDYWLDTGCGKCGGADLTSNGTVDIYDLAQLAENWPKTLCR